MFDRGLFLSEKVFEKMFESAHKKTVSTQAISVRTNFFYAERKILTMSSVA